MKGLDLYLNKEWKLAINSFQKALKINNDKASSVFINRCKDFLKNSPPKDWDGVWDIKIK